MTLFGSHTVDELNDLLREKDYEITQVQGAYNANGPAWHAKDAAAESAWLADWHALLNGYDAAHSKAKTELLAMSIVPGPDSLKPVEGAFQGILKALTKTEGSYTDQDFQGLHNRLVAATGQTIDFSNQPPMTAHDTDLAVYQAADSGIKQGEAAASAAKKSAGDFVTSNWKPIVIGVVALGAGAAIVKKVI